MATSSLLRDYYTVLTDDFTVTNKSILYIFKLMGDIKARMTDRGRMVLSRVDFMQSLKLRAKCFEVLADIVRGGTVVFIGYGGRDQIAFETMESVAQNYGIENVMTSYMLLKDLACTEGENLKYSKRKIVPIQCSFEEFMDCLAEKATERVATPVKTTRVRVAGHELSFSPREIDSVLDFFQVLNEDSLEESAGNKDEFFKGTNRSWGAYKEKWDFEREIYSSQHGLRDRISKELQKKATCENRVLLLTGMPGIGKSIMLRRIAFDNYLAGTPVLIFDSTKGKFDYKVLDSFLMQIDRQLVDLSQGKTTCAKSVILFDDVSSLMMDPRDLSSYLASRGRAALIVCASRLYEIEDDFALPAEDIVRIPQSLNKDEIHKLAGHLEKLGYLPSAAVWREVILKEMESSFFAAMYSLVDPARRPLGKIISDQFVQLSEDQKKVFFTICAFHRFDLPINIELLARMAFHSNYEKLAEVMNDRKLRQIVVISEDRDKNTLYSTYNRIIAQRTIDFFLPDPVRQKELYVEILDNTHFVLQKERELVEKLLIRNMGPSRNLSGFDLEDQLELFLRICKRQPTRSLVHHLGLLQGKAKDYKSAEATLLGALGFHERYMEAYRGESTKNIMTSLGCMYVDWAEDVLTLGDSEISEILFQKAEKYLQDAIKFHYPMPHPYHALARMYMRMGDRCKDSPQRFDYYAQSLEALEQGKENVHGAKTRMLYEIETLLQTRLENKAAIKAAIQVLAKDHRSARGYYLYARAMLARGKSLEGNEKDSALEEAFSIIKEGLTRFPIDEACLRLKAEVTRELYPADDRKYFEALERWFQMSRGHSVPLLYELAVTAFKLGYFKTSFRTFPILERRSRGYPDRFSVKQYLVNEKGQRIIYKGTIMDSGSPYIGEIRVDSMPKLGQNIRFSIELCDFEPKEGDAVSFFIGFDYVAPRAVDVRKVG